MMKINQKVVCLFGLLIFIFSCTKTEWLNSREGSVSLSIAQENVSSQRHVSNFSINNFTIQILDDQNEIIRSFDRYEEMDEKIYLTVGSYKVRAFSSQMKEAAFEAPTYEGENSFSVNDLSNTKVKVICGLSNVKVSTLFTDAFTEVFPHAYAVIQNSSGSLEFNNEETRSGFFTADKITVTVYNKNEEGQDKVLFTYQVDEVLPKDHFIFRFNTQEGESSIDIEVDESTEYKEIQFTIPQDWLEIDHPEMDSDVDLQQPIQIIEGNTAPLLLSFDVPAGLIQLIMKIEDPDMIKKGWPETINFCDLSSEDKEFLQEKGILYSDMILGSTSASIDLTDGLKYFSADKNQIKEYQISFLIEDYFHPQVERFIHLEVAPAVLHTEINEEEIWSYSGTIHVQVEKGNPDFVALWYKEKAGDVWLKNTTPNVINDNDLTYQVTGLKDDVAYEFKAVQNLNESSAIAVNTEAALPIPNSDFEDWALEKVASSGFFAKEVIKHHPWEATTGSPWATVNEKTTEHRGSFTQSYNSLSSTLRDGSSKSGNYAAKLYTVGYGYGNTNAGGSSVVKKRAAAELFLGTYNYIASSEAETRTYGIPFGSRPVTFNGFYKYQPYQSDQFIIEISVENRDGGNVTILDHQEFINGDNTGTYTPFSLSLEYTHPLKATHLTINIKSTTKSKDELETEPRDNKHLGSELWVDQLTLEYK
ncbi:DUF4493 domain-containing protein [Flammeovirga pacifica]|uniref:Putative carbohydrate metabolism domain-containing protein n=1 Tax=Flammeovirga pacifica TaxID=915059 RepID=A0A1S1YUA0_FLAPC|nr:DUF4493 domain-containing protein [Flammeovirga pacifica]OHX64600.1 hypothetical protein NH26_23810 [Flammeovirga pacifica]